MQSAADCAGEGYLNSDPFTWPNSSSALRSIRDGSEEKASAMADKRAPEEPSQLSQHTSDLQANMIIPYTDCRDV